MMFEDIFHKVETPCIVVDRSIMLENIRHMQAIADAAGIALRPHIKTHKIPEYAVLQIAAGAKGISCAKVSEAEIMAAGGVNDIFLAYPQIGKNRIERVLKLSEKVERLIVGVDSFEGAMSLSEAATKERKKIEVRLEIDTGAQRTGISMEGAVELGLKIARLPGLELSGIYTFKSLVLKGHPTEDREAAGKEEGSMMASVAARLRNAGIAIREISAGSTPTGEIVSKTGLVTEIRPGTYIFNDFMLTKEGYTTIDHIAVRILATVVSVHSGNVVVIDGGTKTFPTDVVPGIPPYFYPGYAIPDSYDRLRLVRMYEEHGILESDNEESGLSVGDVISLIPLHVCTAINLQNQLYEYDHGTLRKVNIQARGMLV